MNDCSLRASVEEGLRVGRLIAVVRGFDIDTCLRLAEIYHKADIRLMEIPFDQRDPSSWKATVGIISKIKQEFGSLLHIGAGTVLAAEQLSMMADAGGEFMVAPNVKPDLIHDCVQRGLVAIPGAMTPSEAIDAYEAGASFVKIFPAGELGLGYIKMIKAPLSHIPLLAFGGVTIKNVVDFLKAGCVGVGIGEELTNRELIVTDDWYSKTLANACKLSELVKSVA